VPPSSGDARRIKDFAKRLKAAADDWQAALDEESRKTELGRKLDQKIGAEQGQTKLRDMASVGGEVDPKKVTALIHATDEQSQSDEIISRQHRTRDSMMVLQNELEHLKPELNPFRSAETQPLFSQLDRLRPTLNPNSARECAGLLEEIVNRYRSQIAKTSRRMTRRHISPQQRREKRRSRWLNGMRDKTGWSDLDITHNNGPAYNTIRNYRLGIVTNRLAYVRRRLADAFGCPLDEVPE